MVNRAGKMYRRPDSACKEAIAKDPEATCLECPLAVTYCVHGDRVVPKIKLVATGTVPNDFAE